MSGFLNFSMRTALKSIFDFFAPAIPPASREWSRMEAQDLFELARQSPIPGHTVILRGLILRHFEGAGENLDSDESYKRVLKLAGGKAEFDAVLTPK